MCTVWVTILLACSDSVLMVSSWTMLLMIIWFQSSQQSDMGICLPQGPTVHVSDLLVFNDNHRNREIEFSSTVSPTLSSYRQSLLGPHACIILSLLLHYQNMITLYFLSQAWGPRDEQIKAYILLTQNNKAEFYCILVVSTCWLCSLHYNKLFTYWAFRVGTWNVDLLTGRLGELVEALAERRMDGLCVQETRWRSDCRLFGAIGKRYKLFWWEMRQRQMV